MKNRTALALDTSTAITFVAVRTGSGSVVQSSSREAVNHSEQLLDLIVATLDEAAVKVQDLKQLIVGAGPGSFTGLRIGFSFMKGLASAIARPLFPVSSLAAAAFEFLEPGRLVASIADARREQIFSQLFWLSEAGNLETEGEASLAEISDFWTQAELCARHKGLGAKPITVCVDKNAGFLKDKDAVSPKNIGRSLLELGRYEGFVGQASHDGLFDAMALAELEPNYVRAVAAKTIAQRSQ